jgi:hypothetical protein
LENHHIQQAYLLHNCVVCEASPRTECKLTT